MEKDFLGANMNFYFFGSDCIFKRSAVRSLTSDLTESLDEVCFERLCE